MATKPFKTELHKLEYAFITPLHTKTKYGTKGKKDKDKEYTVTVTLNKEQYKKYAKQIRAFWKENSPKDMTMTYSPLKEVEKVVLNKKGKPKKDRQGNKIKKATGVYTLVAKTNFIINKDKVKVSLFEADGTPINLDENDCCTIGNVQLDLSNGISSESVGIVRGNLGITQYENKAGVTLYLKAVQFKRLIPYTGDIDDIDSIGEMEVEGNKKSKDKKSKDKKSKDKKSKDKKSKDKKSKDKKSKDKKAKDKKKV